MAWPIERELMAQQLACLRRAPTQPAAAPATRQAWMPCDAVRGRCNGLCGVATRNRAAQRALNHTKRSRHASSERLHKPRLPQKH